MSGVTTVGYDAAQDLARFAEKRQRERDQVEREVDEMFGDDPDYAMAPVGFDEVFDEEPECRAAKHGPRHSNCTCEDSRDE